VSAAINPIGFVWQKTCFYGIIIPQNGRFGKCAVSLAAPASLAWLMRPAAEEDGDPALENRVRRGHDNKRRGHDK
jgi:hypothetical protein